MTEIEKYQGIYGSGTLPSYGHSNHGKQAWRLLEKWQPGSLVDVGCGWNEFVSGCRERWPDRVMAGVDFACPGADVLAPVTALPFKDGEFDVLTSFDMLEHLPPAEVDAALAEMARVSRRFIVSISYVPSINKWQGQTLHPTVRPEAWWMTRLSRAGAVKLSKWGRYITGEWSQPLKIDKAARVVLVGNGPSLLGARLGMLIDRCDEVVRFNDFQTVGFEADVGTRTTLWSTFFKAPREMKHPRVLCIHEADRPPVEGCERACVNAWFFNRVRQQVKDRALWAGGFRRDVEPLLASSGLLVTSWLLDVVGVERVFLAGFDHFDKRRSSQHHYWLPQAYKAPKEHDGPTEAAMFEELWRAGRVVYLSR